MTIPRTEAPELPPLPAPDVLREIRSDILPDGPCLVRCFSADLVLDYARTAIVAQTKQDAARIATLEAENAGLRRSTSNHLRQIKQLRTTLAKAQKLLLRASTLHQTTATLLEIRHYGSREGMRNEAKALWEKDIPDALHTMAIKEGGKK